MMVFSRRNIGFVRLPAVVGLLAVVRLLAFVRFPDGWEDKLQIHGE